MSDRIWTAEELQAAERAAGLEPSDPESGTYEYHQLYGQPEFNGAEYQRQLQLARKEDSSASNPHRNVKCPKCDTVQSATHKVCSNCGHDLTKARGGKFAKTNMSISLAKDSLAKASTPEPWSTSKTSNWVARGGGLPDYIQHVSHGIRRSNPGLSESEAIAKAIGVVKRWAAGGGNVDAQTKAAAAKAIAEWEALKAKQHAKSAARAAA